MPNVKIREMRIPAGDNRYRLYRATEGYFLMDGNWKYPESGKDEYGNEHPRDPDGELIDFEGRPHGKLMPGEVIEIDDGHPALSSGALDITTEPANRSIKGIPGQKATRKRRGRPAKSVNPNNAEVRADA